MRIHLNKDVHACHNEKALAIHETLKQKNVTLINLVGSPGSGKTSLLECLIAHSSHNIGVIEGDLFTDLDHQRIMKLGIPSYQLNTSGACHLEPNSIEEALKNFYLDDLDYIFIDNIGNLVCTASFYLGEDLRICVTSTTEGNDKPYKYPKMFYTSDIVVLNKLDLAPYTNFSIASFDEAIHQIHPEIHVIHTSCTKNDNSHELWKLLEEYHARKSSM